jgi:hypothetical protein
MGGQDTPEKAKAFGNTIIERLRRAYRIGVKMGFGTDIVVDLPNKTRADMTWDYLTVSGCAGSGNPEMHDHERRGAASDQQAARSNCAGLSRGHCRRTR